MLLTLQASKLDGGGQHGRPRRAKGMDGAAICWVRVSDSYRNYYSILRQYRDN